MDTNNKTKQCRERVKHSGIMPDERTFGIVCEVTIFLLLLSHLIIELILVVAVLKNSDKNQ
jgi:hypothetical protein